MQSNIDYTMAVTITLSALAMAGQAVAWWRGRGKDDADVAETLTGSALEMFREVKSENRELKAYLDDLQLEFENYKNETNERIAEQSAIIAQQAERISALEKENRDLRAENSRLKSPPKRGNL